MKIETVEKLRDLANVDASIESMNGQRKTLNEEHAANVARIREELAKLATEREAILEVIHSDESVAKDLRKRRGPKKEKVEGEKPTPAKKRGKGDAQG